VRHFGRDRAGQLPLESERPLPDIGRRHVVLGGENERRRSGAHEWLLEAQVRPEALGRLIAANSEWRVAHGIEHRVADVAHVVDAAAGPDDGLRIYRPSQAEPRGNIVVVGLVGASTEPAIAHVWNAPEAERRVVL